MTEISPLLSPRAAAKALGTSYGCLAVWRSTRRYPLKFVRIGRKIFYRPEDIQQFIETRVDPGDGVRPVQFARKRKAGK